MSLLKLGNAFVRVGTSTVVFNNGDAPEPPPPPEPIRPIVIAGKSYPVVRIGNQLWTAENLACDITSATYHFAPYGAYYTAAEMNTGIPALLASEGLTGWRVPSIADTDAMKTFVIDDNPEISAPSGLRYVLLSSSEYSSSTDKYGLSLNLCGSWDGRPNYNMVTDAGLGCNLGVTSDSEYPNRVYIMTDGRYGNGSEATYRKYCVRLVKDYNV